MSSLSLRLSDESKQKLISIGQDLTIGALRITSYIVIGAGLVVGGTAALSPAIALLAIAFEISAAVAFIFSGWGILAIVGGLIAGALLMGAGVELFYLKEKFEKSISTTKTIQVANETVCGLPENRHSINS